jgi:hypothetical protein
MRAARQYAQSQQRRTQSTWQRLRISPYRRQRPHINRSLDLFSRVRHRRWRCLDRYGHRNLGLATAFNNDLHNRQLTFECHGAFGAPSEMFPDPNKDPPLHGWAGLLVDHAAYCSCGVSNYSRKWRHPPYFALLLLQAVADENSRTDQG